MRYKKRPLVVEAEQWFPDKGVPGVSSEHGTRAIRYYVVTIHGQRAYLEPGDWVITEPDSIHHYPCKPEIFSKTYEPAD